MAGAVLTGTDDVRGTTAFLDGSHPLGGMSGLRLGVGNLVIGLSRIRISGTYFCEARTCADSRLICDLGMTT